MSEKFSFEKPEPRSEDREKAVLSIRERFKKAVSAAVLPMAFSGVLAAPEQVGFSKKNVEEMLHQDIKVSEYVKRADKAAKEGEMDGKERKELFQTVAKAKKVEEKIGAANLDRNFGIAGESEKIKEHFHDKTLNYPNISPERAKQMGINPRSINFILDALPHVWIESINEINFVDREEQIGKVRKDYGLKSDLNVVGQASYSSAGNETVLSFFKHPDGWQESSFALSFRHEIAHANDWKNRRRSMPERVDLLHRTLERVKSEDRYYSGYVESIRNEDKKKELLMKASEYWAEIVRANSASAILLGRQDRELVRDYLDKETAYNIPELERRQNQKSKPEGVREKEY